MIADKELLEERGWLGRVARWAAAPYISFKDDRMRLYALICRDVRLVAITGICVYSGVTIPWSALKGFWG